MLSCVRREISSSFILFIFFNIISSCLFFAENSSRADPLVKPWEPALVRVQMRDPRDYSREPPQHSDTNRLSCASRSPTDFRGKETVDERLH